MSYQVLKLVTVKVTVLSDCTVHGILQARTLEWVPVPLPSPGGLPDPGIEPSSPTLQADALTSEPVQIPTVLGITCGY